MMKYQRHFTVLPKMVNKVLMVPVEFITTNFGGNLSLIKKITLIR